MIYISGPIAASTEEGRERNKKRFYEVDLKLQDQGMITVNPLNVPACEKEDCGDADGHTWHCWLRYDLKALLECDSIYMMRNWRQSKGATLELHVAEAIGMEVIYE